jgi:S-adenosylmethionine hydrolase
VDSELNAETKHIALKLNNHYFICPDNGVISLLTSEIQPEKIVEITIHSNTLTSFPVLDVFVKVACHIARGGTLEVIGKNTLEIKKLVDLQPSVSNDDKTITGNIIYIDNYGNCISNISKKLFQNIGKGRDFEVIVNRYSFDKIHTKYSDIVDFSIPKEQRQKDGTRLAIFNSGNYLEIAMYRSNLNTVGGATSLLGINFRAMISVKFN